MSLGNDALATIIVALITAAGAYLGVRIKAQSDKAAAEPASWQSLTSEMKEFFREQLEERDRRIDALERREDQRDRYDRWLAELTLPRPPFRTFAEWAQDDS